MIGKKWNGWTLVKWDIVYGLEYCAHCGQKRGGGVHRIYTFISPLGREYNISICPNDGTSNVDCINYIHRRFGLPEESHRGV